MKTIPLYYYSGITMEEKQELITATIVFLSFSAGVICLYRVLCGRRCYWLFNRREAVEGETQSLV